MHPLAQGRMHWLRRHRLAIWECSQTRHTGIPGSPKLLQSPVEERSPFAQASAGGSTACPKPRFRLDFFESQTCFLSSQNRPHIVTSVSHKFWLLLGCCQDSNPRTGSSIRTRNDSRPDLRLCISDSQCGLQHQILNNQSFHAGFLSLTV